MDQQILKQKVPASNLFDENSRVGDLRPEKHFIPPSFPHRLPEMASVTGAHERGSSPTATLNAIRLPAIAIDGHGFIVDVNAAADVVFDNDIKIKDKRLFVRDPAALTHLKEAIDRLKGTSGVESLVFEPVIVPRMDKLPVIVRIWPFQGPSNQPRQEARALLTLNALGPKPGPTAGILARTFRLTPSEGKLACIIARGAPPYIADHVRPRAIS